MISKQRLDNDHEMKWDKIKFLEIEFYYYKRKYSEMLHIKSTNNILNIRHDTGSRISNMYNPVISLETIILRDNQNKTTKKKIPKLRIDRDLRNFPINRY